MAYNDQIVVKNEDFSVESVLKYCSMYHLQIYVFFFDMKRNRLFSRKLYFYAADSLLNSVVAWYNIPQYFTLSTLLPEIQFICHKQEDFMACIFLCSRFSADKCHLLISYTSIVHVVNFVARNSIYLLQERRFHGMHFSMKQICCSLVSSIDILYLPTSPCQLCFQKFNSPVTSKNIS